MQYTRINLMLPTFKRVKNGKLQKHIQSFLSNASSLQNVCYSFLVNQDDEETMDYIRAAHDIKCDFQVIRIDLKAPHLGKFYNALYEKSMWKGDRNTLVSMVGDDMVCQTKDWDLAILEAMNEMQGLGIVHCRDGIQNGRIAVNMFTSRDWIEACGGEYMPENWAADFVDVVLTEVARRADRERYLENVFLEHQHASLGSAKDWDETTRSLRKGYDSIGASQIAEGVIWARLQHFYTRRSP